MLLTSSGDREAEEEAGAWGPVVSAGLTAAAVLAATIPGARFARGTLRGRPALVVCTQVVAADAALEPVRPGRLEDRQVVAGRRRRRLHGLGRRHQLGPAAPWAGLQRRRDGADHDAGRQ